MASIYENSYITIAAARSDADSTGFLKPREVSRYFSLPSGNELVYLLAVPLQYALNGDTYVELPFEPLSNRAWAFQERSLSLRTVHFGTDRISLECRTHFVTEDGYVHPHPLDYIQSDIGEDSKPAIRDPLHWGRTVEAYSRRSLTYSYDKLPALGGLAT